MTSFNAPLAYRAASLETAACLWEAVLEMEACTGGPYAGTEEEERALMIRAARTEIGSSQLRLTVIGWTDALEAAWMAADGAEDMGGGDYDGAFDWDFVPGWIVANVDWSDPHSPQCRPSRHTLPAKSEAFTCGACCRPEADCSAEPCGAVIADREA